MEPKVGDVYKACNLEIKITSIKNGMFDAVLAKRIPGFNWNVGEPWFSNRNLDRLAGFQKVSKRSHLPNWW